MSHHHHDDEITNPSTEPHFQDVLAQSGFSPTRRSIIRGGIGLGAVASLPMLSACGSEDGVASAVPAPVNTLSFTSTSNATGTSVTTNGVPFSLADSVVLPSGYTATVVHATGDRLVSRISALSNQGTETDDWSARIGDHHDGMDLYHLTADGKYTTSMTDRAILVVNHESSADAHFFHANGQTSGGVSGKKFTQFGDWDALPRPADGLEVLKEINHHGVSLVEVNRASNGTWSYKLDSAFNRRVNGQTLMSITGPAAHLDDIKQFMVTAFDTSGSTSRGTLNNCGHGRTPWGTYLACEENWAFYFNMPAGSPAVDAKTSASRARYGVARTALSATATSGVGQGWYTVSSTDNRFARWNIAPTGATPAQDFRNEPNTFGYNVEIDPADPSAIPAKRIAMGRFAHEAAVFSLPVQGEKLACYMGCDSRNEYIYKFVTAQGWDRADIGRGMAAGNKYLNEGKLYVAKFNADGTGQWIELTIDNAAIKGYTTYAFANQADVFVNARHAATAVGATPMDRPEWGAVNPLNGEVYFALTNNSAANRTPATVNAANPRSYNDGENRTGNANGHIIRFKEDGKADSTSFKWDIFLFGAEKDAGADVNLSKLNANQYFSSPDGLWFSYTTGLLYIQTDDGAMTDESNCMLLVAVPGKVGDGSKITVNNTLGTATGTQETFMGATLGDAKLRRFVVGPKGAEITGLCESADGRTIFVNIQHPGENTPAKGTGNFNFESQWPGNGGGLTAAYGPAGRPRSATIAIRKTDGGIIGS